MNLYTQQLHGLLIKIARSSPVYKKQESKRRQNYKKEMKSKPGDYFGVPLEQLKKECY